MAEWQVRDHQEFTFDGVAEVHVSLIGGDLEMTAGTGPARLEVRVLAGEPVRVRHDNGDLEVEQRRRRIGGRGRAEMEHRAMVRLVVPAEVTASIRTVTAGVLVAGIAGRVDIQGVTGEVLLERLAGDLRARTVSGGVEASGVGGRVTVNTVSGDVTLSDATSASIEVRSLSGDVIIDCATAPADRAMVNTMSGEVVLRVPSDLDAAVRLHSLTGKITSGFRLGSAADRSGLLRHEISGRTGAGGGDDARIDLQTLSGRIALVAGAA